MIENCLKTALGTARERLCELHFKVTEAKESNLFGNMALAECLGEAGSRGGEGKILFVQRS